MKIWISDRDSQTVACLKLAGLESDSTGVTVECLEGELPDGLTLSDLERLAIVTYEPDSRGRPVPKITAIEPSENLEYLRALIEAMPPGYFVSKVDSPTIDRLREEKIVRFQKVIESEDRETS